MSTTTRWLRICAAALAVAMMLMPAPSHAQKKLANVILADEINRAAAKVQAALLEAIQEHRITVADTTHKMPELFMVPAM